MTLKTWKDLANQGAFSRDDTLKLARALSQAIKLIEAGTVTEDGQKEITKAIKDAEKRGYQKGYQAGRKAGHRGAGLQDRRGQPLRGNPHE